MRVPGRDRGLSGLTLVELMIAVAVMAVMLAGAATTLNSSWRQNQLMREDVAAIRAAEAKIAELRGMGLGAFRTAVKAKIVATTLGAGSVYETFNVDLVRGHTARMGLLVGTTAQPEGEVIVILDENPDEGSYGRDLDATTGPDGINLDGNGVIGVAGGVFPLDVNDNASTTEDFSADPSGMKLIPVAVVLRWRSLARGLPGRIELFTVIGE